MGALLLFGRVAFIFCLLHLNPVFTAFFVYFVKWLELPLEHSFVSGLMGGPSPSLFHTPLRFLLQRVRNHIIIQGTSLEYGFK